MIVSMVIVPIRIVRIFKNRCPEVLHKNSCSRGGSRAAATSKMERFVIIVNSFQPLTIITKRSILDVAAVLNPPLCSENFGAFSRKHSYWGPNLIKLWNEDLRYTKTVLHSKCAFLGVF